MKIHTDTTIQIFRGLTIELGRDLRRYKNKVCSHFHTEETPVEHGRRLRQLVKQAERGEQAGIHADSRRSRIVKKKYNDNTYKHHSLGDYVDAIIRYGSTPSLSSQTVYLHTFVLLNILIVISIVRVKVIIRIPSNCTRGPTNVTM
jgi:hypothetical protein